ncbi:hypothetical protein FGE12_03600 [Aggregicoccus sp. 17bor-14]|uniref:hypothetical protein n=1 Tax=Myxococcaceae TaxID=31 RepID=UPI00129CD6FF|nr:MULTISPECIES: hypothetical protein [Myxococcaceae]MBF5041458.1 hypothetical protein [Simulacricoccus sp. 17bor-14]MRI87242.1 hypothetical protein [Aggregicoccus sp. 17bor-14]
MAGLAFSLVVSGLLTAAAAPDPFSFEGPRARAATERPGGFFLHGNVPFTLVPEQGTGSATLEVQDRVDAERATYGDAGHLSATFRLGGTTYGVELTQVGFPPLAGGPRSIWHPVSGGVMLDRDLYGDTGVGFPYMTRVHAAAAVWGVGRVSRNGQLLTDHAIIHAAALSAGAFADDDTHALLSSARAGDSELVVLAWNLPVDLEPRGFIQFVFDDVSIDVQGQSLPRLAVVPTGSGAPSSEVPGGASLGAAPTLETGGTGTGGSGQGTSEVFAEPSATTALQGGIVGLVGVAAVASGATLPTVPGTVQSATGGTPAATAVPPTTAGVSTTGAPPTSGAAVAVSVQLAASPQSGTPGVATNGQLPPAGDVQGFGAPATAGTTAGTVSTIGGFTVVPLTAGSSSASATAVATGTGTSAVAGAPREQSPGLPATPAPANASPATPVTPLPASPAPANAAAAVPLPATPAPLNASPAASAATPLIATPAPLNAAPASAVTPVVPVR